MPSPEGLKRFIAKRTEYIPLDLPIIDSLDLRRPRGREKIAPATTNEPLASNTREVWQESPHEDRP